MRVLLDTCAVSEARKRGGNPGLVAQIQAIRDEDIFLSVITLGEIAKGISQLPSSKKKTELNAWLLGLEQEFEDRILSVDTETARIWGELTATANGKGHAVHPCEGLIAATARRHGLHVITRNIRDFEPTGALLLNPWTDG